MKSNSGRAVPVSDCLSTLLMSLLIQLMLICSVQMSGFSLPPPIYRSLSLIHSLSLCRWLSFVLSVFDVSGVRIKSSSQRKKIVPQHNF